MSGSDVGSGDQKKITSSQRLVFFPRITHEKDFVSRVPAAGAVASRCTLFEFPVATTHANTRAMHDMHETESQYISSVDQAKDLELFSRGIYTLIPPRNNGLQKSD